MTDDRDETKGGSRSGLTAAPPGCPSTRAESQEKVDRP